jgi:hypothetical protein
MVMSEAQGGEFFPRAIRRETFQRQIQTRLTQPALWLMRPVVLAAASVAALGWIKRRAAVRRKGVR